MQIGDSFGTAAKCTETLPSFQDRPTPDRRLSRSMTMSGKSAYGMKTITPERGAFLRTVRKRRCGRRNG